MVISAKNLYFKIIVVSCDSGHYHYDSLVYFIMMQSDIASDGFTSVICRVATQFFAGRDITFQQLSFINCAFVHMHKLAVIQALTLS